MWHVWNIGETQTGVWWGDLRERGHLEDVALDWRIIIKCTFNKWDGKASIGLIWLRIGDRWWALVNAAMNLRVP
jgi:hypothetical protein